MYPYHSSFEKDLPHAKSEGFSQKPSLFSAVSGYSVPEISPYRFLSLRLSLAIIHAGGFLTFQNFGTILST